MAVLSWMSLAGVAIAGGCYSPELRDCAVSCASTADCAPEQVCGSDQICASPELAGRCAGRVVPADAAVDSSTPPVMIDAAVMVDAAPPIDASTQRFLRIDIAGRGGVVVAGVGTCHHSMMLPCTLAVVAGMPTSLQAVPDSDQSFDKWEAGPCVGQGASCSIIPTLLVTDVKAKFRKDD